MILRKANGYWHIFYKARRGGRELQLSTDCKNRRDAVIVARKSGIKQIERAARYNRLTHEAIGRILAGKKITMTSVVDQYAGWMVSCDRSKTSITNTTLTLRRWLRDMEIEKIQPANVAVEDISSWINDPKSEKKRSSRLAALGIISSLFKFMLANGWITTNQAALVRVNNSVMSHDQKESREKVPFTQEEVLSLLAWLFLRKKWFWRFAVACSYWTGLRLSDVANLEWRSFEQPGKLIVWTKKTGARVEHNLDEVMQTFLAEVPVADKVYLFPRVRDIANDPNKRAHLSIMFSRLCAKAGIPGKHYHLLRHSFASELNRSNSASVLDLAKRLANSMSKEEIQKLLGHSSAKMSEHYVH